MDQPATILLIGADKSLAERFGGHLSESYRVRAVGDPAAAVDATDGTPALVVIDARPTGRAVDHLLGTVRNRGYDGRVLAIVEDPDEHPDGVDEYLVTPLDGGALRAAVEAMVPDGTAGDEATVFEALGDRKGRRCCRVLLEAPRSASALADATGYSLPTVYRRLAALQEAGLVESSPEIRPGGGTHEVYRTVTTRLRVDIADGFRVDLEREADEPEA